MNIKSKVVVGLAILASALVIAILMGFWLPAMLLAVPVLCWLGGYLHGRGWFRKSRRNESAVRGGVSDEAVSE